MVFNGAPDQITWVGDHNPLRCPNGDNVDARYVRVETEMFNLNKSVPWCFDKTMAKTLKDIIGRRWVHVKGDHVTVHSSLVIASQCPNEVHYLTWDTFQKELNSGKSVVDPGQNVLLLFHWPFNRQIDVIGDIYGIVQARHGEQARFYPNLRELREAEHKIGDFEVLDHIARSAPNSFAYRPRTCVSTNGCTLSEPFVMKQANTSNSNGVILSPSAEDIHDLLPCQPSETTGEAQALIKAGKRWFHQEKIDSLTEVGEFRLFIVTLRNAAELRGRKGYVFEAIHTIPVTNDDGVVEYNFGLSVLNRVSDELLDKYRCGDKTYKDLEDFALYTFEQLRRFERQDRIGTKRADDSTDPNEQAPSKKRKRPSNANDEGDLPANKSPRTDRADNAWHTADPELEQLADTLTPGENIPAAALRELRNEEPYPEVQRTDCSDSMFESLEMAVRLDIGISAEKDGHRFFVNEVTREWHGDLFPFQTGHPQTRLCKAIANARNGYFFS